MTHIENIMASLESRPGERSAEKKWGMEKQYTQPMPILYDGYISPEAVDSKYIVQEHKPLYQELEGKHYVQRSEPVEAWVYNINAFMGGSKNYDDLSAVSRKVWSDLKKLKCMATASSGYTNYREGKCECKDVVKGDYISFIAFPKLRLKGKADAPVFEPEDRESLKRALAYLITKDMPGLDGKPHRLLPLKAVEEMFGMSMLFDVAKPERLAQIQRELGFDAGEGLREAVLNEPHTGSRLLTYTMIHSRPVPEGGREPLITPQEVEERYGHDMLLKACSRDNVCWVRGLRGLPESSLADELPLADKYLKEKSHTNGVVKQRPTPVQSL